MATKLIRKKIGLLFAGGTMLSHKPHSWEKVRREQDMALWLQNVAELQVVADIEPVFVTGLTASEIGTKEWLAMAEAVRGLWKKVDGFVILHGVETLHYTANALSLMLRNMPLPVVLSGSPLRTDLDARQVEFGARANIINAVQVAAADIAEICVVFGNRIMKASRVQPDLSTGSLQLTTFDHSLLGRVDFGIKLFENRIQRTSRTPRWAIFLDSNVLITTVTPSGLGESLRRLLDESVHGVVLRAHELVSLPQEVVTTLERAADRRVPIFISSRHAISALPQRFIVLKGMSQSMAVIKVMWALGATRNLTKLRNLVFQDIAGEYGSKRGAK